MKRGKKEASVSIQKKPRHVYLCVCVCVCGREKGQQIGKKETTTLESNNREEYNTKQYRARWALNTGSWVEVPASNCNNGSRPAELICQLF